MDDESCFMVNRNGWQQQSYYESEDYPATEDVKFILKTKFPAKVLLWLAVNEVNLVVNKEYLLILTYKDTLGRLEELKFEYVPTEENPPNVPQIRSIENLWANL
jgi:hypothetical protein